ncbi:MAG: ribonuclease P [Desulfurococcaceae archaeon]
MNNRRVLLRDIARERINILFSMAIEKTRNGDFELARRYVEIAIRVASKAGVKLPKKYKRSYCRKCYVPLIPGYTLTIRVKNVGKHTRVTYRCLKCGWVRRFVVKKSKRE